MDHGEYGGSAVHALADGDVDFDAVGVGEVEFGGGAELNHAVALASLEDLVDGGAADDASCDGAGDLPHGGDGGFACRMLQRDGEGFVQFGGFMFEGVEILAGLVFDVDDATVTGAAVDMHIEHAEKDANALGRSPEGFVIGDVVNGADAAVGGADHLASHGGDASFGVTEEAEQRERGEDGEEGGGPVEEQKDNGQAAAGDTDEEPLAFAVGRKHGGIFDL